MYVPTRASQKVRGVATGGGDDSVACRHAAVLHRRDGKRPRGQASDVGRERRIENNTHKNDLGDPSATL